MVFGLILGAVILKERIEILHVISVLICLAGLAVLITGSYMSLREGDKKCSCGQRTEANITHSNNTSDVDMENISIMDVEHEAQLQRTNATAKENKTALCHSF